LLKQNSDDIGDQPEDPTGAGFESMRRGSTQRVIDHADRLKAAGILLDQ